MHNSSTAQKYQICIIAESFFFVLSQPRFGLMLPIYRGTKSSCTMPYALDMSTTQALCECKTKSFAKSTFLNVNISLIEVDIRFIFRRLSSDKPFLNQLIKYFMITNKNMPDNPHQQSAHYLILLSTHTIGVFFSIRLLIGNDKVFPFLDKSFKSKCIVSCFFDNLYFDTRLKTMFLNATIFYMERYSV